MPTLMVVDGVRIAIYPNDHSPAHVHAVGARSTARCALNGPGEPVRLMDAGRFRRPGLNRVGPAVAARLTEFCGKREVLHG